MAFIRNLLIMTFDEADTFNEKQNLKSLFEQQGFMLISEVKIDRTGIVKEWIFSGPAKMGKFGAPDEKLPTFDPARGMDG